MKSLTDFPNIDTLKRRMQSLAMLDAILCPDWEFRYFSFNNTWDAKEALGTIKNGSGDNVFVLFTSCGCFVKEYCQTKPVLTNAYERVPDEFREATREPAFSPNEITACYWRKNVDPHWEMQGNSGFFDPEVSFLLAMIDGKPDTYLTFAKDYFEQMVSPDLVAQVFQHQTLTLSSFEQTGLSIAPDNLKTEAEEIGYPISLE